MDFTKGCHFGLTLENSHHAYFFPVLVVGDLDLLDTGRVLCRRIGEDVLQVMHIQWWDLNQELRGSGSLPLTLTSLCPPPPPLPKWLVSVGKGEHGLMLMVVVLIGVVRIRHRINHGV